MKPFLIALLTACAFPVLARIGETPMQCEARYGKPASVDKDAGLTLFAIQGRFITCQFHEGVCDRMTYTYTYEDASGKPTAISLSDGEIEALLATSGIKETWNRLAEEFGKRTWQSQHGTLTAFYVEEEKMLIVLSAGALGREMAKAR